MKGLLRSLWCAHEDIRHAVARRMWVECLKCGRETDGIRLNQRPTPKSRRVTLAFQSEEPNWSSERDAA
jgi:hypothetical protein